MADQQQPTFPTADAPSLVPPGQATLDRVVQGAHDTVDKLAANVAPHVQKLQAGLDTAQTTLREKTDQARASGDRWAETVRENVRDKPLTALIAAMVVGLVIARL